MIDHRTHSWSSKCAYLKGLGLIVLVLCSAQATPDDDHITVWGSYWGKQTILPNTMGYDQVERDMREMLEQATGQLKMILSKRKIEQIRDGGAVEVFYRTPRSLKVLHQQVNVTKILISLQQRKHNGSSESISVFYGAPEYWDSHLVVLFQPTRMMNRLKNDLAAVKSK